MSAITDAIAAVKDALRLSDDVKRLADVVKEVSTEVRDHERRIIRLEAKWETALELAQLPRASRRPSSLPNDEG